MSEAVFVLRLSSCSLTAVERHKYYVSWLFASFALTTSSMQYTVHLTKLFSLLLLIFSVVPVEAVSVDASFDDPRCETDERVCPNDPLLFTCTVTGSSSVGIVTLPSGEIVFILLGITSGEEGLPVGVTVHSHGASADGGPSLNYTLTLAIDRASILNGSVTCADGGYPRQTAQASCPVATGY